MKALSLRGKMIVLMLADILCITLAALLAYWLLENYIALPDVYYYVMVGITCVIYVFLGTFRHMFSNMPHYTDIHDVVINVQILSVGFLLSAVVSTGIFNLVSRRYILLTYLFSLFFIPGLRVAWRIFRERNEDLSRQDTSDGRGKVRTLLVGAGEGGRLFISSLMHRPNEIEIVGIVDRDEKKRNYRLMGIPVLGKEEDIPLLVAEYNIDQVTIAIPSLKPMEMERILDYCNQVGVTVNQMPKIEDVMTGKLSVNRLRDIDVVDLLSREEVELNKELISENLKGKDILISGAGGSIGSEICRQVAKFEPRSIILLGHGENSIYLIHRELSLLYGKTIDIVPVIADVQDRKLIFEVMARYQPEYVFHAAAHKHIPMMEWNPREAVKNNIYGTKNMAEAAKAAGVKSFVMISSDKAVRPTNVMGSTKRIAEMIVTALNEPGKTKFAAVRFGNVLGSRGSVIPVFKEQIEKGGPVTVTDFRMIRYFMTIPEASRLVIQAGVLANGGEIFILDMGEPVKIVDLAKKMIKLSGYTEGDIPIVETGIRPGEKLYEELLADESLLDSQAHEKIFVGKASAYKLEDTLAFAEELVQLPVGEIRQNLIDYACEHQ
ncbi:MULTISPECIES: polysaccharide biosynthesis protein [Trichococcus]|uniref:Polysaccharide biosynthesis protein n=2 Tax=Trichococcus TaxID=82802 RepID=A0A1W1IGK8_9LACT|nr:MULTISPECIES: nucleoside-diphosphate sugar epimerase/dehydratase [Trichococcus]SFE64080.1 NDP-sugar epimerase, includes UDP-GlcNAc-inverting 4,6-dehydratase FlaA1 and capsular polysaccharide biosynthesis protein EpsC [Trichococcus pasteurii]SLM52158.1 polysaccharide biosynthesis protein [Trichococcus pasteurii]SSB93039.1 polysaccharide biosynthesis protein [Trichococcus pasteurii]SYZ79996.1 polysaccharide biosynthesis protein [Trichococcus shcherbakoviae]